MSMPAAFRVALLAVTATVVSSNPAHALVMRANVSAPYQVGTTGLANVGHSVDASTNYNRIAAGGSFVLTCAIPYNLPITAERNLYTEGLIGGRRLVVTIPATVPTSYNIPGFQSMNRGDVAICTYAWRVQATEGGFKVGVPGIDFSSGTGYASDGSTEVFQMRAPAKKGDDDGNTCIP